MYVEKSEEELKQELGLYLTDLKTETANSDLRFSKKKENNEEVPNN
ncbi:hypothetical protein [Mesobacillus harenae]|nr:hypothetical protein [Mesobacillus harenae]